MIINVSASHSNTEDTYTQLISSEITSVDNTDSQQDVVSEVCESTEPIPVQSKEQVSSNMTTNTESKVIKPETVIGNSYSVPSVNTSFKSYTYYTMINRNSAQWKLQKEAYTDENGLRKVDNCFLVAVASYYSNNLGDIFEITTDTGNCFKVIICDFKSDMHTDSNHQYTPTGNNNSLLEFYVDKRTLNSTAKSRGNISYINGFDGSITKVVKLN